MLACLSVRAVTKIWTTRAVSAWLPADRSQISVTVGKSTRWPCLSTLASSPCADAASDTAWASTAVFARATAARRHVLRRAACFRKTSRASAPKSRQERIFRGSGIDDPQSDVGCATSSAARQHSLASSPAWLAVLLSWPCDPNSCSASPSSRQMKSSCSRSNRSCNSRSESSTPCSASAVAARPVRGLPSSLTAAHACFQRFLCDRRFPWV
mmetsp:Transcript_35239/g.99011  ORF Transcript_35239/g.99011 Transcript_35239/m.99011 type:complete len:212 (-) Transcript_35239:122-757(-)